MLRRANLERFCHDYDDLGIQTATVALAELQVLLVKTFFVNRKRLDLGSQFVWNVDRNFSKQNIAHGVEKFGGVLPADELRRRIGMVEHHVEEEVLVQAKNFFAAVKRANKVIRGQPVAKFLRELHAFLSDEEKKTGRSKRGPSLKKFREQLEPLLASAGIFQGCNCDGEAGLRSKLEGNSIAVVNVEIKDARGSKHSVQEAVTDTDKMSYVRTQIALACSCRPLATSAGSECGCGAQVTSANIEALIGAFVSPFEPGGCTAFRSHSESNMLTHPAQVCVCSTSFVELDDVHFETYINALGAQRRETVRREGHATDALRASCFVPDSLVPHGLAPPRGVPLAERVIRVQVTCIQHVRDVCGE